MIDAYPNMISQHGQKESGRRLFLAMTAFSALCGVSRALAQGDLDAGGLGFRDFGVADNGASFYRGGDPSRDPESAANAHSAKVLSVDGDKGLARVRFETIKIEAGLPLGWRAIEDWERGVAYSPDKRTRAIFWRLDFGYEGVKDAEHYAATKSGAITARRPGIKAQARKLDDGTFLVAYQNVPGDGDKRAVFDLVVSKPGDAKSGALLTLGAPGGDADRTLKLLALMRLEMKVDW